MQGLKSHLGSIMSGHLQLLFSFWWNRQSLLCANCSLLRDPIHLKRRGNRNIVNVGFDYFPASTVLVEGGRPLQVPFESCRQLLTGEPAPRSVSNANNLALQNRQNADLTDPTHGSNEAISLRFRNALDGDRQRPASLLHGFLELLQRRFYPGFLITPHAVTAGKRYRGMRHYTQQVNDEKHVACDEHPN